jgi:hypothetical protein
MRFNRRTIGDECQQLVDPVDEMIDCQKSLLLSHFVNDNKIEKKRLRWPHGTKNVGTFNRPVSFNCLARGAGKNNRPKHGSIAEKDIGRKLCSFDFVRSRTSVKPVK